MAVRRNTHNLYEFMKAHSDLRLEVAEDNTISITFPENCSSNTVFMSNGKIVFIQYATFDSPELFTYDALKDPHYYQNLKKLLDEQTS